jgi:hypothetical protein
MFLIAFFELWTFSNNSIKPEEWFEIDEFDNALKLKEAVTAITAWLMHLINLILGKIWISIIHVIAVFVFITIVITINYLKS